MVEVDNLVYEYPGTRALDGVSLRIAAGEIAALVGPNGAGKTTLLRCLAALEEPYAGSIRIDGIDAIEDPRTAHERIGFLPDHFGVYAALSARRCLLHAAHTRGLPPHHAATQAETAARDVGLHDHLERRAGTLSRGQRQRLAIAQAIVHRPRVLLLDEPASGLDPQARAELAVLLRRLADQGTSIVVSSHILSELEAYSTTMLVLSEGRVLERRALSHPAGSTRRILLRLVDETMAQDAAAFLESRTEVALLGRDGAVLHLDLSDDDAVQAALLRALIERGLPVNAFGPESPERMQDAYLAAIGKGGPA